MLSQNRARMRDNDVCLDELLEFNDILLRERMVRPHRRHGFETQELLGLERGMRKRQDGHAEIEGFLTNQVSMSRRARDSIEAVNVDERLANAATASATIA